MNDLYEQVYPGRPPVVDGLLYAGTYLFVGAPKVGKSFLMAQLAYHVSMGLSLWGYEVRQGAVLYLALEDDYPPLAGAVVPDVWSRRVPETCSSAIGCQAARRWPGGAAKGLCPGTPRTPGLSSSTPCKKSGRPGQRSTAMPDDYEVITKLKRFADISGVCLLAGTPHPQAAGR